MRIKVIGKVTVDELVVLLFETLKKQGIGDINGASLYFGTGAEVVEITAKTGKTEKFSQPKKPAKKKVKEAKPKVDSWSPRPTGLGYGSAPANDNGDLPW